MQEKGGSRSVKASPCLLVCLFGAGEESRTLDLNLGKVALYQLSYSRVEPAIVEDWRLFVLIQAFCF
jgi:hypothetical protein